MRCRPVQFPGESCSGEINRILKYVLPGQSEEEEHFCQMHAYRRRIDLVKIGARVTVEEVPDSWKSMMER